MVGFIKQNDLLAGHSYFLFKGKDTDTVSRIAPQSQVGLTCELDQFSQPRSQIS